MHYRQETKTKNDNYTKLNKHFFELYLLEVFDSAILRSSLESQVKTGCEID